MAVVGKLVPAGMAQHVWMHDLNPASSPAPSACLVNPAVVNGDPSPETNTYSVVSVSAGLAFYRPWWRDCLRRFVTAVTATALRPAKETSPARARTIIHV